jgi:membrane-associated phospholipid phosphatase
MLEDKKHRSLFVQTLVAFVVCSLLFVVCYFFLDRPIAEFMDRQKFARFAWLKWMTYPPPILQTWSPLVIAGLIVRRAWGAWSKLEWTLLISLVSLIVADQFRESLQMLFGRDWPETWIDNNPSLIGTDSYGFHFFAGNEEFGSFPSGHATRTLAFFAPWWIAYPKGRWIYGTISLFICVALVGMNYHFLGDVLVGCILGSAVGVWAFQLASAIPFSTTKLEQPG